MRNEAEAEQERAEDLTTQLSRLEALVELLNTECQLTQRGGIAPRSGDSARHKIFLVHGHDHALLEETARFMERLVLDVTILHEKPDSGRTLIEKFEVYSDVGFAVVLLTADDQGGKAGGRQEEQRLRARQNVILELGYFLGRLGRARVCALYVKGVDIPSDYAGVLYLEVDAEGAWRLKLARELKAAGFSVDMNRAV